MLPGCDTHELQQFEDIIVYDISDTSERQCTFDEESLLDFRNYVTEEIEQIKDRVVRTVHNIEGERTRKQYIQRNHYELMHLCGNLTRYATPQKLTFPSQSIDCTSLCRCLYEALNELEEFLVKQYPGYIDINIWMPESYKKIELYKIEAEINCLNSALLKRQVNNTLIDIILFPLRKFVVSVSSNEITYQKILYLRALCKALYTRISSPESNVSLDIAITFLLFEFNLNTSQFCKYCIKQIEEELTKTDIIPEQVRILLDRQAFIDELTVREEMVYDPTRPNLKNRIISWIRQKIEHLRLQDLDNSSDIMVEGDGNGKIHVNLSSAVLTYIAKILLDTGIVKDMDKSALTRFLISNFQTKRIKSRTLSFGGTRNRFYGASNSTRKAVKILLAKMLNYIKDDETGS